MNAKEIGAYAELRFQAESIARGFVVSRPVLDNRKYDCLLDKQGRFVRVQIKSRSAPVATDGSFQLTIGHGRSSKTAYTADEIDLFALYIHALDIFYIIPQKYVDKLKSVKLYPHKKDHRFANFRENWNF